MQGGYNFAPLKMASIVWLLFIWVIFHSSSSMSWFEIHLRSKPHIVKVQGYFILVCCTVGRQNNLLSDQIFHQDYATINTTWLPSNFPHFVRDTQTGQKEEKPLRSGLKYWCEKGASRRDLKKVSDTQFKGGNGELKMKTVNFIWEYPYLMGNYSQKKFQQHQSLFWDDSWKRSCHLM